MDGGRKPYAPRATYLHTHRALISTVLVGSILHTFIHYGRRIAGVALAAYLAMLLCACLGHHHATLERSGPGYSAAVSDSHPGTHTSCVQCAWQHSSVAVVGSPQQPFVGPLLAVAALSTPAERSSAGHPGFRLSRGPPAC